ncbi:uncharacterized protein A1O5_05623 [Cladophialophora psammophila CBS 110553]|uniref:Xylanolytic transcriptional activator regulatory domain-containing protein n=1 Tax=Cladophialophora psammophila CBS 110553 TaxID=1182543 RepID=W9WV22_9EURO|nr:uncharacterized protein A1O5_05623 [Cladophialophora psammophila CBS 110553]EXJ71813.1 hypothetical protein A1O5_05623 [Cladophialophora psammophila CBS 110553]
MAGITSAFAVATSLDRKLQIPGYNGSRNLLQPTDPWQRQTSAHRTSGVSDLWKVIETPDLFTPLPVISRTRPSDNILDLHLRSFFETIHIYMPIFNVKRFYAKYSFVREHLYEPHWGTKANGNGGNQQFICLVFSVLAMGAFYTDELGSSSAWAAWYFDKAQGRLVELFDAVDLHLVQAVMLMGSYAQHAIKPNLAYNLTGTAIRLAYSIGLNTNNSPDHLSFDAQEALRTWWMLFIQEVELSMDSGRPMSIRSCDVNVDYPLDEDLDATQPTYTKDTLQQLNIELHGWRDSLPAQFCFQHERPHGEPEAQLTSWINRQRSSVRLHYNVALITLNRVALIPGTSDQVLADRAEFSASCIEAASESIVHLHWLLRAAPKLRRWGYYCYYCLQATLVIYLRLIDDPFGPEAADMIALCRFSIETFDALHIPAAKRCAEVFRRALTEHKDARESDFERSRPGSTIVTVPASCDDEDLQLVTTSPLLPTSSRQASAVPTFGPENASGLVFGNTLVDDTSLMHTEDAHPDEDAWSGLANLDWQSQYL